MKSFYKFDFDQEINKNSFCISQSEVEFSRVSNGQLVFKQEVVTYECQYIEKTKLNKNTPVVIIPIRDNKDLLLTTISNLLEKKS